MATIDGTNLITRNDNPVISAEVLSKYAIAFQLGADIMKLGNRKFEKDFSADNMIGSNTSYFVMSDGGEVLEDGLDLSADATDRAATHVSGDAGLRRVRGKTVTLKSLTMRYTMNQEDLDLLIKEEEYGSKMTARAVELVNARAFDTIAGGCNAIAANKGETATETAQNILQAFIDAQAYLEASKMEGQLCGMASLWNDKAISQAYAKSGISNGGSIFKSSQATGMDAGKGFLGFSWAKATAGQNVKIMGDSFKGRTASITANDQHLEEDGSIVVTHLTLTAGTTTGTDKALVYADGDKIEAPFTVAGIYCVDELGQSTGVLKTFTGEAVGGDTRIKLSVPLRFAVGAYKAGGSKPTSQNIDPLANAYASTGTGGTIAISNSGVITMSGKAVTGVLSATKEYYKPCLLWKKDEFLVAVKGLMPMKGADSKTIPSKFGGEKGILPWRGTAWTDEEASVHKVRFDVYYGFGILKGIGMQAIYIEA